VEDLGHLTRRETQVLKYISEGKTNKEIACALSTNEQTVKNQVSSILKKLNANNRTHAAAIVLGRETEMKGSTVYDVQRVRFGEHQALIDEGYEPFGVSAHDTSYGFYNTTLRKQDVVNQTTDYIFLRKQVRKKASAN